VYVCVFPCIISQLQALQREIDWTTIVRNYCRCQPLANDRVYKEIMLHDDDNQKMSPNKSATASELQNGNCGDIRQFHSRVFTHTVRDYVARLTGEKSVHIHTISMSHTQHTCRRSN
jgi:hypothetical protein